MQSTMTLTDLINAAALAGNTGRADMLRSLLGTDCDVPHRQCACCKDWYHPEDFYPEVFKDDHVAAITAHFGGEVCGGCMDGHEQDEDGEWRER